MRFFNVGQKTKKHLTQRIQNLDDKMLEQNELSRAIKDDVCSSASFKFSFSTFFLLGYNI